METTKATSARMRRVKQKGTKPERALALACWRAGLRYRKNDRGLPGSPDLSFRGAMLAVFVDGDFWHGWDWRSARERIRTNRDYWVPKIERNIERDRETDAKLARMGWKSLRFWEWQVKEDPDGCLRDITDSIKQFKNDKKWN